jgi:hypothetical protein
LRRSGFCFVEHENQARKQGQAGEADPCPFVAVTREDHSLMFDSEVSCRNTLKSVWLAAAAPLRSSSWQGSMSCRPEAKTQSARNDFFFFLWIKINVCDASQSQL